MKNKHSRMPQCVCGHGWPLHIIPGGVENIDVYPTERHCVDCGCRNYQERVRVQIIDRQHPHFEEYGHFTGNILTMKFGTREQMAEVTLENCRHGVDGCFVRKGEVRQVPER